MRVGERIQEYDLIYSSQQTVDRHAEAGITDVYHFISRTVKNKTKTHTKNTHYRLIQCLFSFHDPACYSYAKP